MMLVNLDPGKSYLGVYLGSGPCVAAMRTLIETDYDKFEQLFQRELQHRMKGGDPVERLERAWRIYSQWRLAGLGLGGEWERAYLEMDEFDLFLGSYNVFHFGARFPLFFGTMPSARCLWNGTACAFTCTVGTRGCLRDKAMCA